MGWKSRHRSLSRLGKSHLVLKGSAGPILLLCYSCASPAQTLHMNFLPRCPERVAISWEPEVLTREGSPQDLWEGEIVQFSVQQSWTQEPAGLISVCHKMGRDSGFIKQFLQTLTPKHLLWNRICSHCACSHLHPYTNNWKLQPHHKTPWNLWLLS